MDLCGLGHLRWRRTSNAHLSACEPDPLPRTPELRRGSPWREVRQLPASKQQALRGRALDLIAQDEPVARVAKDLGIRESCLRRWREQDAVDTGRKESLRSQETKEPVELRRRNRVLEMEIEILKRARNSAVSGYGVPPVT